MKWLVQALSLGLMGVSMAAASVPANLEYKTIGNPTAPQGGTFQMAFSSEPEKLNPINSSDLYASYVQEYVMDGMMTMNLETYELEPALAERYELSKDQMTYTFFLRKDAKFSDGKPVTAEDVKFSFDSVKDPRYKAVHRIPYYENIGEVTVVDPHTVKITTKKKYFLNLEVMATVGYTAIVPKHLYGDPNKKMNKDLVGSGPYVLESYNKGKNLTLAKNKNWWGWNVDHLKGKYNFDKIMIRFVKEENLEIEMLKKAQLDYDVLTPEAFMKKTEGAPFGTTIIKKKVENSDPTRGYGFVAWNFKNPLFKDRDVRVALAHLMNREEMNQKFRYGLSVPATGPWQFDNPHADSGVKPFLFDIEKAKTLLKKAGWEDRDKNGILDKTVDGKKAEFRFELLFPSRDVEKYFTLYKEDLKKAGIEMNLKVVEWNTFVKSLDEQKFDAVSLAWGGGSLETDQKQIWHSDSAKPGGSNFISYSNKDVDKLIDQAREELDAKKRSIMWKKIYRMIADDAPYAFLFNEKYVLYAHNKKIGMVKDTYKYNLGRYYWWVQQ
ncbi:MAG: ABC transporter substrate-binding protein [Bdellovibrionales bacterium]